MNFKQILLPLTLSIGAISSSVPLHAMDAPAATLQIKRPSGATDQELLNAQMCGICHEDFTLDENNSSKKLTVLRCIADKPPHIFHKKCLEAWILTNPKCPMCSTDISHLRAQIEQYIRLKKFVVDQNPLNRENRHYVLKAATLAFGFYFLNIIHTNQINLPLFLKSTIFWYPIIKYIYSRGIIFADEVPPIVLVGFLGQLCISLGPTKVVSLIREKLQQVYAQGIIGHIGTMNEEHHLRPGLGLFGEATKLLTETLEFFRSHGYLR